MDYQAMYNLAIAAFGVVVGALSTVCWHMIKQLQTDHMALQKSVSENYVRRDDYRDDMRDVKAMLTRIEDKLDSKADK